MVINRFDLLVDSLNVIVDLSIKLKRGDKMSTFGRVSLRIMSRKSDSSLRS